MEVSYSNNGKPAINFIPIQTPIPLNSYRSRWYSPCLLLSAVPFKTTNRSPTQESLVKIPHNLNPRIVRKRFLGTFHCQTFGVNSAQWEKLLETRGPSLPTRTLETKAPL